MTLEGEVFTPGGSFVNTRFLSDAADGAANALWFAQDIDSGDAGFTGIGRTQRGEDFDGSGFACAVGSE